MALRSKFILWTAIVLLSVIVLGTVSLWNLLSLRRAAAAAAAEYDAMDRAEATITQVIWVRDVLNGPDARLYRDARYFAPIQKEVVEIVRELRQAGGIEDGDAAMELLHGQAAADHLDAASKHAPPPAAGAPPPAGGGAAGA